MIPFIAKRLLLVPITILGLATLMFILVRLLPGDPATVLLGDYATIERVEALEKELGLDRPLYIQYFAYLSQLVRCDFGLSYSISRPVSWLISQALRPTALLAGSAMLISILVGVASGTMAAFSYGTWLDYGTSASALLAYSTPAFWVGLLVIMLFGIRLDWFPITGAGTAGSARDVLAHLALPAVSLGLRQAGLVCRMTRTAVLEVLQEDYIRTARAKGLTTMNVLAHHALRNAAIPIVTIIGLTLGSLLGGTVVTETVFSRPGLGRLLVTSVSTRDFVMLQGLALVWGSSIILINLLVDIIYCMVDPRIRYR